MVLALTSCRRSNITVEETDTLPEDVLVIKKTEAAPKTTAARAETTTAVYTIPAEAETGDQGGPGVMETEREQRYDDYPDDKKPGESDTENTMICIYTMDHSGLHQDFALVETCDADSLINCLVEHYVLAEDTKVKAFSASGRSAKLELSKLEGTFSKARQEWLTSAIANTFTENLDLDSLEIVVDGQSLGSFEYSDRYNAT